MILRLSTADEKWMLLRDSWARIPGTARILRARGFASARKMRAVPGPLLMDHARIFIGDTKGHKEFWQKQDFLKGGEP
jgi:hypothetical protein